MENNPKRRRMPKLRNRLLRKSRLRSRRHKKRPRKSLKVKFA